MKSNSFCFYLNWAIISDSKYFELSNKDNSPKDSGIIKDIINTISIGHTTVDRIPDSIKYCSAELWILLVDILWQSLDVNWKQKSFSLIKWVNKSLYINTSFNIILIIAKSPIRNSHHLLFVYKTHQVRNI